MQPNTTDKKRIQSIQKGFTIVRTIQRLDGATSTELLDELGFAKSSLYLYLSTLEELNYIRKDNEVYQLGLNFLYHGDYARKTFPIYDASKQEVEKLAEKTNEVVWVIVEEHGKAVNLVRGLGEEGIQTRDRPGLRSHLHYHAAGKTILAHLPESRVEEIFDTHGLPERTENTITDRETLAEEFGQIREQGYGTDDEEAIEGLRGVAAPIIVGGDVLGAITVLAPTRRMQGERFTETLPNYVLGAANAIELNLKYNT